MSHPQELFNSVHGTTVPNQEMRVALRSDRLQGVTVVNRSRTSELWVVFGGDRAEIEGPGCFVVLGARTFAYPFSVAGAPVIISLKSVAALKFSVEGSPDWSQ